jgi:hypothetical protein
MTRTIALPLTARQRRLIHHGLLIAGIVVAVMVWYTYTFSPSQPVDVSWYWRSDPANLYPHPELAEKNGYNYSPAFEMVVGWGRLIPFDVFTAIWRAALLAALVYLAGPLTIFVIFWPPIASEINAGNIQIFLALAIFLSFRFPGAWAFVILTKVSPAVAMAWWVVRREWRYLAIALGFTGAVALVAFVLWPDRWPGWIALITTGKTPSVSPYYLPLTVRLPFAIALALIGGWRGWRWTVPVAATLALPVFYAVSLSMLVGVLPFVRQGFTRLFPPRPEGADPAAQAPDQPSSPTPATVTGRPGA